MTLEEVRKLDEERVMSAKALDEAFLENNRSPNMDTYSNYLKARLRWSNASAACYAAELDDGE